MMLPSLVPLLARYRRTAPGGTVLVAAGYFTVWAAAGVAAYALGTVLWIADQWWPAPLVAGLALVVAALVQWTPWKSQRLQCCREFGWRRESRSTRRAALSHGLQLGAQCCLCCAGLMTFLIATGMMRLGILVLVAALIALERFAPHPRIVARAAGAIILIVGVLVISTTRA